MSAGHPGACDGYHVIIRLGALDDAASKRVGVRQLCDDAGNSKPSTLNSARTQQADAGHNIARSLFRGEGPGADSKMHSSVWTHDHWASRQTAILMLEKEGVHREDAPESLHGGGGRVGHELEELRCRTLRSHIQKCKSGIRDLEAACSCRMGMKIIAETAGSIQ